MSSSEQGRGKLQQGLADERLMALAATGSTDALATLYDRFARRAYGMALTICRDEAHAEDAVQEAFLSIWRNSASYEPQRGTVAAWLLTVVRYRALDMVRHVGARRAERSGDEAIGELAARGDVVEETLERDDAARVRELLARLPDAQREVVTLAFFGQLSHIEIAAVIDVPIGTVKSRIRLGLGKLHAGLDPVLAA